ncbi:MAG: winged helix DNA-binding protein [Firmicutes bacterium]|nr:winged helix DNA-binding protein [Bacillota bacterium]
MKSNKLYILYVISNLIRGLNKALENDLKKTTSSHGLTLPQFYLLSIIYYKNGATLSEVSEYGNWHLSTVMDLIRRTEKKGLTRKELDGNDARTKRVYITEEGKELFNSLKDANDEYKFLETILQNESSESIEKKINSLYDMNKVLNQDRLVGYVRETANVLKV